MDATWVNGVLIGATQETGQWQTPRMYEVPAGVIRAGANSIAVRVLDTGGAAGFTGEPGTLSIAPHGRGGDPVPVFLAGEWFVRRGASLQDIGALPSRSWLHQNRPSALYNAMLAPLVPFEIRGAIWYQGESNRPRAMQYRRLFPAMIADWRRAFGQGDFPFYFVQIAPYTYGGDVGEAAELREAQLMTLSVPNTGMAVTMDIGNPGDIHPSNKQDVGDRLARWALAKTYGRDDVACSGPVYRAMSVEESRIRLAFNHADGLRTGEGELRHFTIAGVDRDFHPASAMIEGEDVLVWSDTVPNAGRGSLRVASRRNDEPLERRWPARVLLPDGRLGYGNDPGKRPAGGAPARLRTGVVGGEQGSPPPVHPLQHVRVIGASVTQGLTPGNGLGEVIAAMILCEREAVEQEADLLFFANPIGKARAQLKAARESGATMLVGVDFLFWFGYGLYGADRKLLGSDDERLQLLEAGLLLLGQIDVPIAVGDFPDMSDAIGGMLLEAQVPEAETLVKLNARLRAWASERENVVILPLAHVIGKLRADEEIRMGKHVWPAGSADLLLLPDRLHTTREGQVAIASLAMFGLVEAGLVAEEDVELDVAAIPGTAGRASARGSARAVGLARTIHEHPRRKPHLHESGGCAGLSAPAGTLRTLTSSTTLQGRLRGQRPQSTSRNRVGTAGAHLHE